MDSLPTTVEVGGREISINSDYRTGILFELMMTDITVPEGYKAPLLLDMYYPEIPDDIDEAVEQALLFYRCGKPLPKKLKTESRRPVRTPARIYDYNHDADYIFAAFLQQYSVDLTKSDDLHWWSFVAMFKALTNATEMSKIMGYRAVDITKIRDKDEKSRMQKLKALHAIPNMMTAEEKARKAASMFGGITDAQ